MSLDELKSKFLIVSRRKRESDGKFSPAGQPTKGKKPRQYMGRKGLGKLAGFGVAKKIIVTTKKSNEKEAHRITLDFDEIKKFKTIHDVKIPYETISAKAAALSSDYGTRIELTRLVYSGIKTKETTILNRITEYFRIVDIDDFAIFHDDKLLESNPRGYAYAYPENDNRTPSEAVTKSLELGGKKYAISYRIRFTENKNYLPSDQQGIRIYAHNRLAAMPSRFDTPSSSTGYHYMSYMDGYVIADFIDEQDTDYISTDRQTLRWETPLLEGLYEFIKEEIVRALSEYYKHLDVNRENQIKEDPFTQTVIAKNHLTITKQKIAYKIAEALSKGHTEGIDSTFYKNSLETVIAGLGKGSILEALSKLAAMDCPDIKSVYKSVTELASQEFDDLLSGIHGRLKGIEALGKIHKEQDWKNPDNEKALQTLLEKCPWIIDPTFFQFLSADQSHTTFFDKLKKELKVSNRTSAGYDPKTDSETLPFNTNKRPDLTFLLGNKALKRIIIVELKSPNTPLLNKHLTQLLGYIWQTEAFLKSEDPTQADQYQIKGLLIGQRAEMKCKQEEVELLRAAEAKRPDNAQWKVVGLGELLEETEKVHKEFIEATKPSTAS